MPIKLKDYGRNQKKRKEDIHQSGLLLAGVDVSKAKHAVRKGTSEVVRSRMGSGMQETWTLSHISVYKLLLSF